MSLWSFLTAAPVFSQNLLKKRKKGKFEKFSPAPCTAV